MTISPQNKIDDLLQSFQESIHIRGEVYKLRQIMATLVYCVANYGGKYN